MKSPPVKSEDRILISELAVDCIVGTLPHEREKTQRILIDLEMACDLSKAGKTDDLVHAHDYARAAQIARRFCVERKAQLLETLAQGISELLLREFPVESVRVRVAKPAAIPNAQAAAVEITRQRNSPPRHEGTQ